MSTLTKEQLLARAREKVKSLEFAVTQTAFADSRAELEGELELARIALASLEAEPAGWQVKKHGGDWVSIKKEDVDHYRFNEDLPVREVYTAPPAPVSVPAAMEMEDDFDSAFEHGKAVGWNACRAAMLQGVETEILRKAAIHDALCEKYSVESLADFVDWQRNHITELEAAPPAPVGPGEPAVMQDYPGYVMTQRECFQAGAKRAVPDGWVVVPIEPTMEILDEFDSIIDYGAEDSKDAWGRLIAAAPQQEVKP